MFHLKLLINFLSLSIAGQIDWHALGKFAGSTGPALKPSGSLALLHQADPSGLLHVDNFVPTRVLACPVGPHNHHGSLQQQRHPYGIL